MNKKMKMLLLAVFSSVVLTETNVLAQSPQEQIQQIINSAADSQVLPPTVDENGNIKALKFVGAGVLHKSLPKAIRLKKAASAAQTAARKAAANYFNTQIKWEKTENNEIVCKTIGISEGESEGASRSESATTELTKEQSHECSQAALNGLVQIGQGENPNGLYVVVYAWNPKSSAFATQAAKIMGKAARQSITEAKAAEGASLQDPNAAYQNAAAKDAAEDAETNTATGAGNNAGPSSSRNAAPVIKTTVAPGAEDFF